MSGARLVVLAAVSAVAYLLYLKLEVRFKSLVSLLPPPERDLHSIFSPILFLNRCRKMRLPESVTAEASDHPEPEQEPDEEDELDQRVNYVEEKIEVIDLVVNENEDNDEDNENEDNDDDVDDSAADNWRITRAFARANEIIIIYIVKLTLL